MTYEAWRGAYQSSEQAAHAAYATVEKLALEQEELSNAVAELVHVLGIHEVCTLSEKTKSILGKLLKETL